MNQNCEASAPRKPAPSEGRQAAKLASRAFRSKAPSQTRRIAACRPRAQTRVVEALHHRGALVEGQDRPAKSDRRDGKEGAGSETEKNRSRAGGRQARARLHGHDQHARGRDRDRQRHGRRQVIAQKQQPEQRHLHRLGLGIGRHHREGALAHGREHQRGRHDLRDGAGQDIGQEGRIGSGNSLAGGKGHPGESEQARRESRRGTGPGSRRQCRWFRSADAAWRCGPSAPPPRPRSPGSRLGMLSCRSSNRAALATLLPWILLRRAVQTSKNPPNLAKARVWD